MTRLADQGYTKGVAVLTSASESAGLGFQKAAATVEYAAYLATTGAHDDLADHHAQFAAAFDQEVRSR